MPRTPVRRVAPTPVRCPGFGKTPQTTILNGKYGPAQASPIPWQALQQDREAAAGYIELALRRGSEASLSQMKTNSSAWSSEFRKALQARLKAAGVYDGAVDGRFGPATYTAMDEIFGTE